jgi:hypothetical protein
VSPSAGSRTVSRSERAGLLGEANSSSAAVIPGTAPGVEARATRQTRAAAEERRPERGGGCKRNGDDRVQAGTGGVVGMARGSSLLGSVGAPGGESECSGAFGREKNP